MAANAIAITSTALTPVAKMTFSSIAGSDAATGRRAAARCTHVTNQPIA